ncbi:MAG: TonB-dependent receptor, partial [Alteromonadales bacterium]|nr:TonB-dependent receptor [Alteromonadales bacterium]
DLRLNGGLGLLESEIKDNDDGYQHINGNELSSAPGVTANIGARYWFLDGADVGFSVNYVDDYFGEITNSQERVAGDYIITKFDINYILDKWQFTVFVNNALDEEALVTYEPVGRRYPQGYAGIVDPRSIGASVTFSF